MIARLKREGKKKISGKEAFALYSSFGYPIDLTIAVALENGIKVDKRGFEEEKKFDQNLSKSAAEKLGNMAPEWEKGDFLHPDEIEKLYEFNPTNNEACYEEHMEFKAELIAIKHSSGFLNKTVPESELTCRKSGDNPVTRSDSSRYCFILDKTSFYAESGGQINDTGTITGQNGTFLF